ncbi:MAG: hypothetical protein ACP5QS_05190 [bacterium]
MLNSLNCELPILGIGYVVSLMNFVNSWRTSRTWRGPARAIWKSDEDCAKFYPRVNLIPKSRIR